MSLPSGYKRLKYIQSSGTQYVNSNFKANQNTRVVIDFEYISGDVVFGAYDVAGANGFGLQAASNKWYTYYGTSSAYSSTAVVANTRLVADVNKNVSTLNGAALRTATANTFSGANPLIISGMYNASAPSFLTALKIYSCQIYDNGTLVRDFIPCQTTSGDIGLWDDVNSVFYGNAGTGTFTAGSVIAIAADKSEITKLKYIQSSGTQYIDTNVSAPEGFRITCDVEFTSLPNTLNMLFGSHDTTSPYYRNFLAAKNTGKWEIGAYNPTDFGSVSVNTKYSIDVCTISGAIGCSINGIDQSVDSSIATSTVRSSRTIYLFGLNYTDGLLPSNMKLYGLKMYLDADGNNLVRDYIAAKLSNGTVGLYDKLNGLLYINAGTDVFEAGPSSLNLPVNIGGTWKDANEAFVNIGGTWKTVEAAFVNIDGTWKELS